MQVPVSALLNRFFIPSIDFRITTKKEEKKDKKIKKERQQEKRSQFSPYTVILHQEPAYSVKPQYRVVSVVFKIVQYIPISTADAHASEPPTP